MLDYYPEAQQLLLKRANDLMDINAARDKANQDSEIASSPSSSPEFEIMSSLSSPPESEVFTDQQYNEVFFGFAIFY